jgi:hypothetical protein
MTKTDYSDGDVYYAEDVNDEAAQGNSAIRLFKPTHFKKLGIFDDFKKTTDGTGGLSSSTTNLVILGSSASSYITDGPRGWAIGYADDGNPQFVSMKLNAQKTITRGLLSVDWKSYNIEDAFTDSAVGAGWTTAGAGTVSEDTKSLNFSCSNNGASAYWGTTDYYQSGKTAITYIDVTATSAAGPDVSLRVYDGLGADVTLFGGASSFQNCFIEIHFPTHTDYGYVFVNGFFYDKVNLSGLGGTNRYIGYNTTSGGAGQTTSMSVFFLGDDSNTTATTEGTFRSRVDGTNWETTPNDEWTTFSNTGSTVEVDFNLTRDADEIIIINGWSFTWQ